MKRHLVIGLMGVLAVSGIVPVVLAAEHGGQAVSQKSTSPAPVTQTSSATTARGSITALDLQSPTPMLKLTAASGESWTLGIDPASTTVFRGTQLGALSQLRVGEKVSVRTGMKNGKQMAKSIEIISSGVAQPAAEK